MVNDCVIIVHLDQMKRTFYHRNNCSGQVSFSNKMEMVEMGILRTKGRMWEYWDGCDKKTRINRILFWKFH